MNDRVQTIRNAEKARNGEIVRKNTITVLGTNLPRPLDEEECQYLIDMYMEFGHGRTHQFGYELPAEHYSLLQTGLVDEQWETNSTVMVLLTPEGLELATNMVADDQTL
ncbi:MAG: hypothetical protein CMF61_06105 [Magnetococcales bacterium]|nr:hypothetical protein [Magnetococcales bacterium]